MEDVDPSLCYIQYMKFCRRTEGTSSARLIFKKAREDPRISYHVYVASALMEYYCTKDSKIAGNIFELGFKKFKSDTTYVLEYLSFLSHLNDDNNTRVLFERAVTSDALKPVDAVDIWNKFLEFETNIGDLSVIENVEKRRSQAFDLSEIFTSSPTARLIERYKYIDLYPCTKEELVSIGYSCREQPIITKEVSKTNDNSVNTGPELSLNQSTISAIDTQLNGSDIIPVITKKVFKPDTSQMVPFKPKFRWLVGEHRVSGGGFPLPPAVSALCQTLPPPDCYQGPFVMVDRLMDVFMTMTLPHASLPEASINVNGAERVPSLIYANSNVKNFPSVSSIQEHVTDINRNRFNNAADNVLLETNKRIRLAKHGGCKSKSDDEDESIIPAPMNDLYRQRQQKKLN